MEAAADRAPLILIHGAWLSSESWETFADYYRGQGWNVSAPGWPRKAGGWVNGVLAASPVQAGSVST